MRKLTREERESSDKFWKALGGVTLDFDNFLILHKRLLLPYPSDRTNETYAWRFTYKGKKYSNGILGKWSNPITDKRILLLMQGMVETMKYLLKKNNVLIFPSTSDVGFKVKGGKYEIN